ncbi:MAG: hypothetical protein ACR2L9_05980 [Solirubrobacteraceae bacterium]
MKRAMVTLCLLGLLAPSAASASGGPATPVLGGAGVTASGSPFNYIALAVGPNTLVEQVRRAGGIVESSSLLTGGFGVPGVTSTGSTTGLSADGRTLVLTDLASGYSSIRTRLIVLSTIPALHVRARLALSGFFTVDAISPTGRWLYFTHYRSHAGPTDYEIRAYDLMHLRLLAKPVVDPRHPGEKMTGSPVARIMSADGRWAYTLYQSFSGAPFVHALDTARRTAFCIDLPKLTALDVSSATLALSHSALQIDTGGTPAAAVDTRTFAVSVPSAVPARPQIPHPAVTRGSDSGLPWVLGIGLFTALIALVRVARRRGRIETRDPRSPIEIDVVSTTDLKPGQ